MPDGQPGQLSGLQNELVTPGQPAPANSGLLPGSNAATPPGQPPDYKALGAGQARSDFAAASANGSWEFDPEAIDKVIKRLDDTIHGELTDAVNDAASMTGIDAPGDEVASQSYVDLANKTGALYQEYIRGAADFVQSYRDTLAAVRDAYHRQDQAALDALRGLKEE